MGKQVRTMRHSTFDTQKVSYLFAVSLLMNLG